MCIHSPLDETWQQIAASVPVNCYQQVLPPVWDRCHLQKSVVIVKCLSPSSEFKELLGSLVQMPFRWVKWTGMNPTSVLPALKGCDEWSSETLWQGLQGSTRWWDAMSGLCFCIWHPQLFLYPSVFLPKCNLTSVLNEPIILAKACACVGQTTRTPCKCWELAEESLVRGRYVPSAFWKHRSIRRTLLRKI